LKTEYALSFVTITKNLTKPAQSVSFDTKTEFPSVSIEEFR